MNVAAILAGGSGVRMGGEIPKQFIEIRGKTIIEYTIDKFENHPEIDSIYLVCIESHIEKLREIVEKAGYKKVRKIMAGGRNRRESSCIAVNAVLEDYGPDDIILIQDGVRPNISAEIISENIRETSNNGACNTVVPAQDTIIVSEDGKTISDYPDRSKMFLGQTPQSFKLGIIKEAHDKFEMPEVTDDCALVGRIGRPVSLVMGDKKNIKITTPEDLGYVY